MLAAAEYADASGREFLTALAVAYQVQCRLSDEAPVRAKGFDHTTQGSYAAAAGVAKALGLDHEQTSNAIAIAGTALNALRVTRTGALSQWKGLAYPFAASWSTRGHLPGGGRNHRPRRSIRGQQGVHGDDRGPVRDRLGRRGSRARSLDLPQALQRRNPLSVRDRSDCSTCAPPTRSTRPTSRRSSSTRSRSPTTSSAVARKARRPRSARKSRPTTRSPTCSRSLCSTGR